MVIRELKKRTNLFTTFATLFSALGNFKACEKCYVYYLKLISVNFGKDSLETSNCYFLMGVFYVTSSSPASQHLKKAVACFMACLKIRLKVLPDTHTSISDCYFNIAIVLFLARHSGDQSSHNLENIDINKEASPDLSMKGNLVEKSLNLIWNALAIRIQNCGEENIHVAKIYEVLGLIFMELGDEKNAIEKFRMCLAIKWELLGNQNHPEIQQVIENLQVLLNKIEVRKQQKETKIKDLLGMDKDIGDGKRAESFMNFLKKKEQEIEEQKAREKEIISKIFNPDAIRGILEKGKKKPEQAQAKGELSGHPFGALLNLARGDDAPKQPANTAANRSNLVESGV